MDYIQNVIYQGTLIRNLIVEKNCFVHPECHSPFLLDHKKQVSSGSLSSSKQQNNKPHHHPSPNTHGQLGPGSCVGDKELIKQ